jgi:hypothetical protein
MYAYEAGKAALEAMAKQTNHQMIVQHHHYLGYYRIEYENKNLFADREDIAAVGGKLLSCGKVFGGCIDAHGKILYQGTHAKESGYFHRAAMSQDAFAVDIRCMVLRPSCHELFHQVVGVPYLESKDAIGFDARTQPQDTDWITLSLKLAYALHKEGYRMLWDPAWAKQV